jgi:sugar phosphate isomerase/epimerase
MKLGAVGNLIRVPDGPDAWLARIDRAAEMGLSVVGVWFFRPEDRTPEAMKRVAEHGAAKGIELRTGSGGSFGSASAEERKAAVERTIEMLLDVNKHTGITFASIANLPMTHTRWVADPPMSERIDMIAENLGAVADAVASAGITLGLENHCDYRGWECAAMLEKANRPNLKAQIDTGNAFTVFEEPVDCARAMAKWVVSVHLKDIKVTPLLQGKSVAENAPLGAGMVDNVTCCQILMEQAPDPKSIALLQEPLAMPPEAERDEFLRVSTEWCRKALAKFLD